MNSGMVERVELVIKAYGLYVISDKVGCQAHCGVNSEPGRHAKMMKMPTEAITPKAAAIGTRRASNINVAKRAIMPTDRGSKVIYPNTSAE